MGFKSLISQLDQDWPALLDKAKLPSDCLDDNDHLISSNKLANLLEICARDISCSDFGIRLAQHQGISMLGHLGILIQQSRNLGEMLNELKSLLFIHSQAGKLETYSTGDLITIEFKPLVHDVLGTEQLVQLSLAVGLNIIKALVTDEIKPESIYLTSRSSSLTPLHYQVFGEHIKQSPDTNCIVLNSRHLALPIASDSLKTKSLLTQMVRNHARESLLPLEARVREGIRHLLPIGQQSIERVASYLEIHPRTLQRRLKERGLTYQTLLDDERFTLSKRYLKTPHLDLVAISKILGFRNQSTFSKSFKQWSDRSPMEYAREFELRDTLRK